MDAHCIHCVDHRKPVRLGLAASVGLAISLSEDFSAGHRINLSERVAEGVALVLDERFRLADSSSVSLNDSVALSFALREDFCD